MRICIFTLLALSLPALAQDPQANLKLLEGTWTVESLEVNGVGQSKDKKPREFVIAGTKLTGIGPDMTITLNPAKNPKWIDLTFKKADKDFPIFAIYEIDGDELKLCFPVTEKGNAFQNIRPEKFETKGKAVALFTARREK